MTEPHHAYLSLAIKDELPLERIRIFNMMTHFDIITDSDSISWERSSIIEYKTLAYFIYQRVVNPSNKPIVVNTNFGFSAIPLEGTLINQLNELVTYLKMLDKIIKIDQINKTQPNQH